MLRSEDEKFSFKGLTKGILTGLSLIVLGGSCGYCAVVECAISKPESRLKTPPSLEEVRKEIPGAVTSWSVYGLPPREQFIYDVPPQDGQADIIGSMGVCQWVASNLSEDELGRRCINRNYAHPSMRPKIMTPEIREAASKSLKADQELTHRLAHREYNSLLQAEKEQE